MSASVPVRATVKAAAVQVPQKEWSDHKVLHTGTICQHLKSWKISPSYEAALVVRDEKNLLLSR